MTRRVSKEALMAKEAFHAAIVSLALATMTSAQTPAGPEFQVNTYTYDFQTYARIGMEPDGDFIVVWHGWDGSGSGSFGQRYDAAGVPRGGELQFNTITFTFQGTPDVAVGKTGEFTVVWADASQGIPGVTLQGRRFDPAGAAIGDEFRINNYTTPNNVQRNPRIGRASDGSFVVTWEGMLDSHGFAIAAR